MVNARARRKKDFGASLGTTVLYESARIMRVRIPLSAYRVKQGREVGDRRLLTPGRFCHNHTR